MKTVYKITTILINLDCFLFVYMLIFMISCEEKMSVTIKKNLAIISKEDHSLLFKI